MVWLAATWKGSLHQRREQRGAVELVHFDEERGPRSGWLFGCTRGLLLVPEARLLALSKLAWGPHAASGDPAEMSLLPEPVAEACFDEVSKLDGVEPLAADAAWLFEPGRAEALNERVKVTVQGEGLSMARLRDLVHRPGA